MNKIRELREAKGMTQRDLAKQIGVTQAAVAFWEMGKFTPSLFSIMQMSKIFSIPLEEMAKLVS